MVRICLVFFFVLTSIIAQSAPNQFSFAGHVTLKNDAPEVIQLTLFEGDFLQVPEDEDMAPLTEGLKSEGYQLESEVFYSTKDGTPNLLIMLVSQGADQSILILDLEVGQKYFYNVSRMEDGKLISSKPGFSDYILEVK